LRLEHDDDGVDPVGRDGSAALDEPAAYERRTCCELVPSQGAIPPQQQLLHYIDVQEGAKKAKIRRRV
jgi:hypothetical protein